MAIGQPQHMLLREFGQRLIDAFGTENVYHVGSSVGEDKVNWRDVDVRVLLDDRQWRKLFGNLNPNNCYWNAKWRAICIVFSDYGRRATGLPIDFQIQLLKDANKKYPNNRSHLGIINIIE